MSRFSLVMPAYNEEASIPPLAKEIEQALAGRDWECLWVDDCSSDSTLAVIQELCGREPRHRAVTLARNSGQSAALMAGFRHATGDVIGTMDSDGQNNPADLPKMLDLLVSSGADLVNGRRAKRRDTWVRKLSSRIANAYRNTLTGESVSDVGCAIRVFRRECVRQLPPFRGMHRFLPTLIKLDGWSIVEIPVDHRPREQGSSKYGINNRLWVGILDTFGMMWIKSRYASSRSSLNHEQ
jgi:dolichol-phosphate mannosyltransferase